MKVDEENRFRRLLRWYPRRWRDGHGEALLGIMLEQAESQGRAAPTRSERRAAVTHGWGARLNAVLAVATAIAALGFGVIAAVGWQWVIANPAFGDSGSFVVMILSAAVVPLLSVVSVVASLRHRGVHSDVRALSVCAVITVALTLNLLTQVAWSLGFEAADAGTAAVGLGSYVAPLGLGAWATGATAVALSLNAFLARSGLPRGVGVVLVGVASVIGAPMVGVTLMSPFTGALLALGAVLLAGLTVGTERQGAAPPVLRPALRRASTLSKIAERQSLVHLLAALAAMVGGLGAVFAFTGALWSSSASDDTVAMAQGIIIMLAAGIPLVAAIGILVARRSGHPSVHLWGPLGAIALSLLAAAAAYTRSPDADAMAPGLLAASAFGGVAIGWWMIPRLRLGQTLAVTISVLTGLVYATVLGILVTPLLAFAVPFAAIGILIWGRRRTKLTGIHASVQLRTLSGSARWWPAKRYRGRHGIQIHF